MSAVVVSLKFRSTPLREGRPEADGWLLMSLLFRSTPPRKGRLTVEDYTFILNRFRSTPPREGRQRPRARASMPCCFDPRPRVRGDGANRVLDTDEQVSIHAPA